MAQESITYGYQDEKLNQALLTASTAIKNNARKDGAHFGKQDRPGLTEPTLDPFVGRIRTGCEEERAKHMGIIQPSAHAQQFRIATLEKEKKERALDEQINEQEHGVRLEERELEGKAAPKPVKRNPLIIIFLIVCYLAELIFNASAFEFLSYGLLGSYGIALGVTGASFGITYGIVRCLMRAKTEGRKMYLYAGLCAAFGLLLIICMSVIRANLTTGEEGTLSPWIFFGFNVALLAGIVILSYFSAVCETSADCTLRERFEKLEKRKEEIKRLKAEKDTLDQAHKKEEETYLYIMSQAKHTDDRIRACYREAVELFKTENLISRKDQSTPDCFRQPVFDLVFPPHGDIS